jgi:hypothetical protein
LKSFGRIYGQDMLRLFNINALFLMLIQIKALAKDIEEIRIGKRKKVRGEKRAIEAHLGSFNKILKNKYF